MYQDDLVSIVTPAYNAGSFVRRAIESAQAQTYPHWEMVVADDVSKDDTRAVVASIAAQEPRVTLVALARNGGPSAARNAAIDRARGRFVAFLDSDDWWLPEKLERQLKFMRAGDAALSYTQFRRVRSDDAEPGRLVTVPPLLTYRDLLRNTSIATSTAVVDRARTGDFRMTKTYYDDFVLWLELLKRGAVAHGLQEDLMRYRVVGGSVSRNKGRSAYKVWRTYRDIEKLGYVESARCFVGYAGRAMLKYRRF